MIKEEIRKEIIRQLKEERDKASKEKEEITGEDLKVLIEESIEINIRLADMVAVLWKGYSLY